MAAEPKVTIERLCRNPDPYGRQHPQYRIKVTDGYSSLLHAYTSHYEPHPAMPLELAVEAAVEIHFKEQAHHRIKAWKAGR